MPRSLRLIGLPPTINAKEFPCNLCPQGAVAPCPARYLHSLAARALVAVRRGAHMSGAHLRHRGARQSLAGHPRRSDITRFAGGLQPPRLRQHAIVERLAPSCHRRTAELRGAVLHRSVAPNAPGIKVLAYQALWWLRPADKQGYGDCLPGAGSYPESWYLHNGRGQREAWSPGTAGVKYGMDFANPAYLQACAQHLVSVAKTIGADGIFLDGAPTSIHWAQLPTACSPSPPAAATCASDANFQQAMTAALGYVTSTLHSHGLLAFVNISGGNVTFCCQGGPARWQQYVSHVDGAMQESWTYGTNHRPLPATEVKAGLLNTAWSEAHGKSTLVNDDITNCQSCSAYGLATMLLVAAGRTSYDTANGSYAGNYGTWWPSYTSAQGLGTPLGAYTTLPDGLMLRRFTNGYVVVNDTTGAISDPTYGWVNATSALIR